MGTELFHAGGQTDMMKLSFRDFSMRLKKKSTLISLYNINWYF